MFKTGDMTIKSIFLAGFISASVLATADAIAAHDGSARCDAYTSATNVTPPTRRSARKTGGEERRPERMRSKTKRDDLKLCGDSAVSVSREENQSVTDSATVGSHKR